MHNMLIAHTCRLSYTPTHTHTLTSGFVEISEDRFDCCADQNHYDYIDWICTHTHSLSAEAAAD